MIKKKRKIPYAKNATYKAPDRTRYESLTVNEDVWKKATISILKSLANAQRVITKKDGTIVIIPMHGADAARQILGYYNKCGKQYDTIIERFSYTQFFSDCVNEIWIACDGVSPYEWDEELERDTIPYERRIALCNVLRDFFALHKETLGIDGKMITKSDAVLYDYVDGEEKQTDIKRTNSQYAIIVSDGVGLGDILYRDDVREILSYVPAKQYELCHLVLQCRVFGYTIEESAKKIGVSEDKVKKARAHLKDAYTKWNGTIASGETSVFTGKYHGTTNNDFHGFALLPDNTRGVTGKEESVSYIVPKSIKKDYTTPEKHFSVSGGTCYGTKSDAKKLSIISVERWEKLVRLEKARMILTEETFNLITNRGYIRETGYSNFTGGVSYKAPIEWRIDHEPDTNQKTEESGKASTISTERRKKWIIKERKRNHSIVPYEMALKK